MKLIKIFFLSSFFILLTACSQNEVKDNNVPNDNTLFNNEINEPIEAEDQIPNDNIPDNDNAASEDTDVDYAEPEPLIPTTDVYELPYDISPDGNKKVF